MNADRFVTEPVGRCLTLASRWNISTSRLTDDTGRSAAGTRKGISRAVGMGAIRTDAWPYFETPEHGPRGEPALLKKIFSIPCAANHLMHRGRVAPAAQKL